MTEIEFFFLADINRSKFELLKFVPIYYYLFTFVYICIHNNALIVITMFLIIYSYCIFLEMKF